MTTLVRLWQQREGGGAQHGWLRDDSSSKTVQAERKIEAKAKTSKNICEATAVAPSRGARR